MCQRILLSDWEKSWVQRSPTETPASCWTKQAGRAFSMKRPTKSDNPNFQSKRFREDSRVYSALHRFTPLKELGFHIWSVRLRVMDDEATLKPEKVKDFEAFVIKLIVKSQKKRQAKVPAEGYKFWKNELASLKWKCAKNAESELFGVENPSEGFPWDFHKTWKSKLPGWDFFSMKILPKMIMISRRQKLFVTTRQAERQAGRTAGKDFRKCSTVKGRTRLGTWGTQQTMHTNLMRYHDIS